MSKSDGIIEEKRNKGQITEFYRGGTKIVSIKTFLTFSETTVEDYYAKDIFSLRVCKI